MQVYGPTEHKRNFSQLSAIQFPGSGAFSAAVVAAPHVTYVTDTNFLLLLLFFLLLPNIYVPSPQGERLAISASLGCSGLAAMSFVPSSTCASHLTLRGSPEGDKAVAGVGNSSQAIQPWSADPLRNLHNLTLSALSVAFVSASSEEAGPRALGFIQWARNIVFSLALSSSSFLQCQSVSEVVLLTSQLYRLMNNTNHYFSCFLIFFFFLRSEYFEEKSAQFWTDLYLFFNWAVKLVNRIFITYSHQRTLTNKGIFC